MMSSNPVLGSNTSGLEQSLCAGYVSEFSDSGISDHDKWPIWVRLAIIIGLSAGLWALIIIGLLAIF